MCNEDEWQWWGAAILNLGNRRRPIARTGRFTIAKTAPCMRAWVGHRPIVDTVELINIS